MQQIELYNDKQLYEQLLKGKWINLYDGTIKDKKPTYKFATITHPPRDYSYQWVHRTDEIFYNGRFINVMKFLDL